MKITISSIDLGIVIAYLVIAIAIGIYFSKKATKSVENYFIAGRVLPWWILGTSMVATTFSCDTPLAISGLVVKRGIAGNWYLWSYALTHILGVFFFAHLWRKTGMLTDIELAELRYSGKAASVLRAFRGLYFALIYNTIVMGWVNLAMAKIITEITGLPKIHAVSLCFIIALIYTTLSGLWGVVMTDLIQFSIAMFGAVFLAVNVVTKLGGMGTILQQLQSIYGVERANSMLSFIPSTEFILVPFSFFLIYIGLQWWSSGNTDCGSYFAQRMFAAKNEKHASLGFLWFNIANYCLRYWPWIIVGLASAILYFRPDPETGKIIDILTNKPADTELGYIRAMKDFLPVGVLGIMLASLVAAFMSTIDTQLNWGASYLVNDFYRRFLVKNKPEKHYVFISAIATVVMAICGAGMTLLMTSIVGAWELLTAINAGIGVVYLLRWYWWRINAWSELTAMISALVTAFVLFNFTNIRFPISLLYSVPITACVWLTATFLTKPTNEQKLIEFYKKARPAGIGWKRISSKIEEFKNDRIPHSSYIGFVLGVVMIFLFLYGLGELLMKGSTVGGVILFIALLCGYLTYRCLLSMHCTVST